MKSNIGARYYTSDLSIWLSVDPLSDKYPSLSPYNYCANNPVMLVDPNGEEIIQNEDPYSFLNSSAGNIKKEFNLININNSNFLTDKLFGKDPNKQVSAGSLGIKKGANAEQIISKLISNNMKKGDYIKGSDFNFYSSSIKKAIDKIEKKTNNSFTLSFTSFAKTLSKFTNVIDIESSNVDVTVSKGEKGGYDLFFQGLKYEGTNQVHIEKNKIYWKDENGKRWSRDLSD